MSKQTRRTLRLISKLAKLAVGAALCGAVVCGASPVLLPIGILWGTWGLLS